MSEILVIDDESGIREPLCEFLGAPVPSDPFPRTNDRAEFWDLVAAANP